MPVLSLFLPDVDAPDSVSVPEVVAARLRHLADRVVRGDFSPDNFHNHQFFLGRFEESHPLEVKAYRQADLEAWIDRKRQQWPSGHTRKNAVNVVVACFQWAADPERGAMIERCPFRRVQAVTAEPYQPRRAATVEEYKALIEHGAPALKHVLFAAYSTGSRPCEMREVIWPWVKLQAATPHLEMIVHKTIRKTGKPRLIALDQGMLRLLRFFSANRPRTGDSPSCRCSLRKIPHLVEDHVFPNCHGKAWSRRSLAQNLRRAAVRAGLDEGVEEKVSMGCLRTTYACDLIELGFSNSKVAAALGHETTFMVDHVYGAEARRRVSHLDEIAKEASELRKKRK